MLQNDCTVNTILTVQESFCLVYLILSNSSSHQRNILKIYSLSETRHGHSANGQFSNQSETCNCFLDTLTEVKCVQKEKQITFPSKMTLFWRQNQHALWMCNFVLSVNHWGLKCLDAVDLKFNSMPKLMCFKFLIQKANGWNPNSTKDVK